MNSLEVREFTPCRHIKQLAESLKGYVAPPEPQGSPEEQALNALEVDTQSLVRNIKSQRVSVAEHSYGQTSHKIRSHKGSVEVTTIDYFGAVWRGLERMGINVPHEIGDSTLPSGQFRENIGSYESTLEPGLTVDVAKVRNVNTVNLNYMVSRKNYPRNSALGSGSI